MTARPSPVVAQRRAEGAATRNPVATTPQAPTTRRRSTWRLPVALLVLSVIPIVAGSVRVAQLTGSADLTPASARFVATPLPVIVHIICAGLYSVLGAFQFSAGLRRRHRGWHRAAGRLLVPLGLAVAISALWMTVYLPRAETSGTLLYLFRLLFGSAMAGSLVLGVTAIRRRDLHRHGAWMARAYAIGLGAGTQAFTLGLGGAIFGAGVPSTDLLMGAGWGINLAVAEWAIHRRMPRPSPRAVPLARALP